MRIVAKGTCLFLHAQLNLLCNRQNFPVVYHTWEVSICSTIWVLWVTERADQHHRLKGEISYHAYCLY